jgi:hypothetical protein
MRSRFHRRSPDFAGLWDRWIDPATKEEILSCTVIVSGASEWAGTNEMTFYYP